MHGLCATMAQPSWRSGRRRGTRERSQHIKRVVIARLEADGRGEKNLHRKVHRPWGWYDSVDAGPRFQVKRIMVKPGASLSLQMHHHRAEHWIVVQGTAEVTCGDRKLMLSENQSTYIPLGETHRLANPGKVPQGTRAPQSMCDNAQTHGTYDQETDLFESRCPGKGCLTHLAPS